jgi:hypothetical protein
MSSIPVLIAVIVMLAACITALIVRPPARSSPLDDLRRVLDDDAEATIRQMRRAAAAYDAMYPPRRPGSSLARRDPIKDIFR